MALTLSIRKSPVQLSVLGMSAIVIVLVCIAGFGGALLELIRRWNGQEEYSHGFLIPIVTAWLLWTRRDAIADSIGPPSLAGLVLIALAIIMNIVGELSAIFIFSQVGFVIALLGIVLAIGGIPLFRVTFIPIAYLLFAIPLPYFIDAKLTLQLQLLSSELGVFVIRLFQIPVYLDGNIIDMGTYKLQVVEACSGLRYLYPLLSLSFLAAYLFRAPLWQRALVLLSGAPIAIGMNGFRIGLVGFLVDRWGTQMAEGALHFFEGWVIFLACSAILAGEIFLLARLSGRHFTAVFHLPDVKAPSFDQTKAKTATRVPLLLSCLALLCAGGLADFFVSGRAEIVPERNRFVAFPTHIGLWQGHMSSLDLATEQYLKVDDYILADYSRFDGKPVNFYVAYYASQRKNESPHSPIVCLPGGGWLITHLERRNFGGAGPGHPFNRVIIQKDSARDLVYYWFDERGRTIADEYWAKWYLLTDSIMKNRTDGALVRLSTLIGPNESEEDADQRLESFMTGALPRLRDFVPSRTATSPDSAALRPVVPGS
jgi:exosortase D (VPLPA-CTERM-specific)